MFILYVISILSQLIGFIAGLRSDFRIHQLSLANVLKGLLLLALFFTGMSIAWNSGYLSFFWSSTIMIILYSLTSGYLFGYSYHVYQIRNSYGSLLYVTRSFITDHLPAVVSLILILFGLYRTALLTDLPVTGIRLSSGLSLIAAGMMGFTLRIIPELREKGLLILDLTISWKQVISWRWESENIVTIECLMNNSDTGREDTSRMKIVTVRVPDEQKNKFEAVIRKKTDEVSEERQEFIKSID